MKFDKEIVQILCPYGEWPHPRGMQVVDEVSARKMRGAAASIFSGRIPIFVGHPDDSPKASKAEPVGYVKKICLTSGGIAIVSNYGDGAFKKIESGELRALSPRWQMENVGGGKFRPVRLISAGLTNNPNIPSSGRIVTASERTEILEGAKGLAEKVSRKCSKALEAAAACAKRAGEIEDGARAAAVSLRVVGTNGNEGGTRQRAEKPSAGKLAELAAERSKRLGEPYTKSFASLRRELF